eukprot:2030952-Pyramimonas_sp.AAC.2
MTCGCAVDLGAGPTVMIGGEARNWTLAASAASSSSVEPAALADRSQCVYAESLSRNAEVRKPLMSHVFVISIGTRRRNIPHPDQSRRHICGIFLTLTNRIVILPPGCGGAGD